MQKGADDKFLVKQVLSGNRKAFEQLVRQYEGLVLNIVTPLARIEADREDICQDVFVKVFEKLNTFEFRSKLSTWIGNIAYNTSISFLQKKRNIPLAGLFHGRSAPYGKNVADTFEEDFKGPGLNPEQAIIRREELDGLFEAIDSLPEMQKTVLLLFYQDDLSLDEISQILEAPVNTVKSHLFRARKCLREKLSK